MTSESRARFPVLLDVPCLRTTKKMDLRERDGARACVAPITTPHWQAVAKLVEASRNRSTRASSLARDADLARGTF
jgi:hypothetical protein